MDSVTPQPPGGSPSTTGATILVVDDSPVNLRLVVRTLEGRGYRLLAAKNGRAALDIARRVHPDLILLDVMMPELDGPTTLERLRSAGVEAPVVFLTAKVQAGDRRALEATGAAGILAKPFDPMQLPAELDRVLQEAP